MNNSLRLKSLLATALTTIGLCAATTAGAQQQQPSLQATVPAAEPVVIGESGPVATPAPSPDSPAEPAKPSAKTSVGAPRLLLPSGKQMKRSEVPQQTVIVDSTTPPQAPSAPTAPAAAGPEGLGNTTSVIPQNQIAVAVDSGVLADLDPSAVGTLDSENGGFNVNMWQGSRREVVETLITRLSLDAPSAERKTLAKRLLLTRAAVPQGGDAGPTLLRLRIEQLIKAGLVDDAASLMQLMPDTNDPALLQILAETLLLSGDTAGACDVVMAGAQSFSQTFWLKGRAYCEALKGDMASAEISAGLVAELGDGDRAYETLISTITGAPGLTLASLPNPTPLHLAMVRTAQMPLPSDVMDKATPAMMIAIATNPKADAKLRLMAAEQAEQSGTFAAEALGRLYETYAEGLDSAAATPEPAGETPAAEPASRAEEVDPAKQAADAALASRARSFKAVIDAPDQASRIAAMTTALDQAAAQGKAAYGSMARTLAPFAAALPKDENTAAQAPLAARLLIAKGDFAGVTPWFALAEKHKDSQPAAYAALWPLAVLLGLEVEAPAAAEAQAPTLEPAAATAEETPVATPAVAEAEAEMTAAPEGPKRVRLTWTPEGHKAWQATLAALPRVEQVRRSEVLLSLLASNGVALPMGLWREQLDVAEGETVTAPPLALLSLLQDSMRGRRLGETTLLSLTILGSAPQGQLSLSALSYAIFGLNSQGLNEEARRIAAEEAVARGL